MAAFIYLITSLYKLIYNKALTATWSVCETHFCKGVLPFSGQAFLHEQTVYQPVFLRPYQHTETHTHTHIQSTVAVCFLFDLSPSSRVRLGRTLSQGANVLFWYMDSLLCYLSKAFILLFTLSAGTVCTVSYEIRLGPISSYRYFYV